MLMYEIIQAIGMTRKKYFDAIFMLAESEGEVLYKRNVLMFKARLRGPKRPTKSFVL